MLVPAGKTEGIFPAALGLVKALNDKGVKAARFTPFAGELDEPQEGKTLCRCCAFKAIAAGKRSDVLESVVANFKAFLEAAKPEIAVVEGVTGTRTDKDELNAEICHALDADIITVITGTCKGSKAQIDATLIPFASAGKNRVIGTVVLNHDAPRDAAGDRRLTLSGCAHCCGGAKSCGCKDDAPAAVTNVLATIEYAKENYAPRASDIAAFLDAKVTSGSASARAFKIAFDGEELKAPMALLTSKAPAKAETGIVILAGGAKGAVDGAAVIETDKSVWAVAEALARFPAAVAADDSERLETAAANAAGAFGADAIKAVTAYDKDRTPLMSPAAFRNMLASKARAAHMRIALPEGDEPRTVKAASIVAQQGIAVPVLYGKKEAILKVAAEQGVTLGEGVEFVDPDSVRANYIDRLVELRQKKGMTPELAEQALKDNVFLATMMIERGEIDGLVSGAVHTTANTIRPAFQILKTAPGAKLVSGGFFMLMPEQVYFYADCAVNLNPDADQISEIAIQSADTAKAFGIDPKVALITYSTHKSGKGADVDLMTQATELVKQKRPDLAVDGPLQYDAAVMPSVAAQKAPGSPVAGKATVFVFPSLSTGNTVYKAVQRSAGLVAIGPLLQGLRKPVNDLSRGALVDDIVYTIAVTAIQAEQAKQN
jgi:phosphate acetyltransferase